MKTIEIIDPINGKGRGREYFVGEKEDGDENSIYLGLIVRDEKGHLMDKALVTVTATDSSQNRSMQGTGNRRKIIEDGHRVSVPYYPYRYEFKIAGKHTITFEYEGIAEMVELLVKDKKSE